MTSQKHFKIKNGGNPFQENPNDKTGLQSGFMGDYDYIHNGCLEVTFKLVTKTLFLKEQKHKFKKKKNNNNRNKVTTEQKNC
jgi:hypothetical protein